ncbi:MAG: hypothetical protein JSS81_12820 [Acidobacteria bacterium]|nr:hypothetical protein [Acidobacteriota bacterium]
MFAIEIADRGAAVAAGQSRGIEDRLVSERKKSAIRNPRSAIMKPRDKAFPDFQN